MDAGLVVLIGMIMIMASIACKGWSEVWLLRAKRHLDSNRYMLYEAVSALLWVLAVSLIVGVSWLGYAVFVK
jgi:hypothetical protein